MRFIASNLNLESLETNNERIAQSLIDAHLSSPLYMHLVRASSESKSHCAYCVIQVAELRNIARRAYKTSWLEPHPRQDLQAESSLAYVSKFLDYDLARDLYIESNNERGTTKSVSSLRSGDWPSLEFSEITSYLPLPERVRMLRDTMMKST